MTRLRRLSAAIGVTTLACVGAAGCGSGASSASVLRSQSSASAKSGTIRLFATVKGSGKAAVVVTGVIGDFGRSFPADRNGKANSNDNFEEVILNHGTFVLDERALSNKAPRGHSNRSTCSTSLTVTAKVPVSKGTGAYAGIRGSLRSVGRVAVVEPRHKSGSLKGKCEYKKPSASAYFGSLTGEGSVTF